MEAVLFKWFLARFWLKKDLLAMICDNFLNLPKPLRPHEKKKKKSMISNS